jgi:TRAP transporter 4TM/12TM fusion protein
MSNRTKDNTPKTIFKSILAGEESRPLRIYGICLSLYAVSITLYHIWVGWHGPLESMINRSVHVSLFMALIYIYPSFEMFKEKKHPLPIFLKNIVPGIIVLVMGVYYVMNVPTLEDRMVNPEKIDLIFGGLLVIIVIEAARRAMGPSLPIIVIFLLLYSLFGQYFPGDFAHRGFSLTYILAQLYLTTGGIFGILIFVMSTYIFLFLVFGTFLQESGGGEFFMDAATALTGHMVGGPAKASVIGSAFFGSLSGSSVANVVTTGSFTIPTMKKMGYSPRLAGAIEAVASTGGQFMPPIMGAAAFIMAEMVGVPYITICKVAVVPAIIYFFAAGVFIHFESKKRGFKGLPKSETPNFWAVLKKGGLFIIPLFLILGLLISGASPMKVGFYAFLSVLLISFVRKETRPSLSKLVSTFELAAKNTMPIAAIVACAGMIISLIMISGIGPKLSVLLVGLARGSLILLLVYSMIASLILGIGMTTIGVYVILAVTVIPTLIDMGVNVFAAHLFAFYFGTISYITPPVALSSIAAAGVAGSNPMKTGYTAFRIALLAFLVPYIFVYRPSFILIGDLPDILLTITTSVIGVIGFCGGIVGYLKSQIGWLNRLLLLIGGFLLIIPGYLTDIIGLCILIVVWFYEYRLRK